MAEVTDQCSSCLDNLARGAVDHGRSHIGSRRYECSQVNAPSVAQCAIVDAGGVADKQHLAPLQSPRSADFVEIKRNECVGVHANALFDLRFA